MKSFKIFVRVLEKKEIQRDRIHILISLRSDQGSMDRDMERSEKIISAIKQNGFITEDNATTFIHTIKMKIEESKRLITSSNIRMRLLNY